MKTLAMALLPKRQSTSKRPECKMVSMSGLCKMVFPIPETEIMRHLERPMGL